MTQFSVLLAASLLVSTALAAGGNVCKQSSIVNMPQNGQPYYWPLSWRENSSVPQLATGQSCSWTVTIPTGYYAKLSMAAKFADEFSRVQMVDAAGNLVLSGHEEMVPYYFPEAKMTLIVLTEGYSNFAFKIEWGKIPAIDVIAGIGSVPHLFNATDSIYHHDFGTSEGDHISMMTFPVDRKQLQQLRSVLVYNGVNNVKGVYVNNLAAIFDESPQQYISAGPGLQVVNLAVNDALDKILIQDYKYTKDIINYTELYCEGNTTCTATVNAGRSESALISVAHYKETLTDIQMDDNANMTVYYGSPNGFGFYKSWSAADLKSQLPLSFYGDLTQYVISVGRAIFTFTVTPEN